jgi:hypothetical protein
VQVEAGSVATQFERRPPATELALCQRYAEKSYPIGTPFGSATGVGRSIFSSNGSGFVFAGQAFNTRKAYVPNIQYWDTAGNATRATIGGSNNIALVLGGTVPTEWGFSWDAQFAGGTANAKIEHQWLAIAEIY